MKLTFGEKIRNLREEQNINQNEPKENAHKVDPDEFALYKKYL